MIHHHQYRRFKKCIAIACLVFLPFLASAQSDFNTDTVVEDIESYQDTTYSNDQTSNDTAITFRSTPDSVIGRLKEQKEFAYANDSEFWKKEETSKPRPIRSDFWEAFAVFLQYLLFAVFIVVLIYILIRILSDSKIILFKRKKSQIAVTENEEMPEETDLSSLIAQAENQQQYRLATRYRYMQLLEEMSNRQLIRTHTELTNWDYIRQMGTHPLTSKFRYLTLAYEYVWYGEFEVGNEQYSQIKNKFETFFH